VVVGAQNWVTPPYEFDAEFFPQASWILDAINEKILPLPGHKDTVNNYIDTEQLRKSKNGV
jgi:2-oxoisovalerate dehydrogenase E1 component